MKIKKTLNQAKLYSSLDNKVSDFLKEAQENLFDCCLCKCKSFDLCSCSSEKRVLVQRQCFIIDQRTIRQIKISFVLNDALEIIDHPPLNQQKRHREDYVDCKATNPKSYATY